MAWLVSALVCLVARTTPGDGWDFLAQGKPAYARTAFSNQLRKAPEDNDLRVGLGLAELALGNAPAATEHLLTALRVEPDRGEARAGLADAFLLRARERQALGIDDDQTRYLLLDAAQQAQKASELLPGQSRPLEILARVRMERGELEAAREAIARARDRDLDPRRAEQLEGELEYFAALRALGEVESAADDGTFEKAEAALLGLLQTSADSAELYFRLGDLRHTFEHWDAALDAYGQGLALHPFAAPYLELLLAYLAVPEFEQKTAAIFDATAERALKEAPRNDPRPGFALFCQGQARLQQLDHAQAAERFREALERDPALGVRCQLGRGEAAFRAGNHAEATRAFLAALELDREQVLALVRHWRKGRSLAGAWIFLANQEMESGHRKAACDLLGAAVEFTPEDTASWNNYAFLCRELGRHEESYRAYSRVIELAPEHPRYLNDCAVLLQYYLKRDPERAAALYDQAIAAAEKILADPRTSSATETSTREALRDARNNREKLGKTAKR